MWSLMKIFSLFALLIIMLSGCALKVFRSDVGSLSMKYDNATRLCEIEVAFRGQRYRQVFHDESDLSDYHQNLVISIPEYILVDEKTKHAGYLIFGGCKANISANYTDSKIAHVYLGLDLPSRTLTHDSKTVVTGLTPEALVRTGFSVTIPIDPDEAPVSSLPRVFIDDLIKKDISLIQLVTSAGDVAGIRQKDVFCSSNSIWILGGTLSVPPGSSTPTDLAIGNKPSSLKSYDVIIDRWEYDGVVSGYSC